MRYAACIEYDGTAYCGWQRLSHARSVQNEIEKVLSQVADESIEVTCAGRTDSGVHAYGQIIHFDTTAQRGLKGWLLGCNSNLPEDIAVRWIREVDDDFHARFSASAREYRYVILNHQARSAIHARKSAWVYHPLQEQVMHEAAQYLLGEHDFSSFRAAGCQARHASREVQQISVSREGDFVYLDIRANAFLHHMVRNIAGSLIMIGQGDKPPFWLKQLLDIRDRKQAGPTAPASGLYFVRANYPQPFGLPDEKRMPLLYQD